MKKFYFPKHPDTERKKAKTAYRDDLLKLVRCDPPSVFGTLTFSRKPRNVDFALREIRKYADAISGAFHEAFTTLPIAERGRNFERAHGHILIWRDGPVTNRNLLLMQTQWKHGLTELSRYENDGGAVWCIVNKISFDEEVRCHLSNRFARRMRYAIPTLFPDKLE